MSNTINALGLEDRTHSESRVLDCAEDVCVSGAEDLLPLQNRQTFIKPDASLITWKEFQKRTNEFIDSNLRQSIFVRDLAREQIDNFKDVTDVSVLDGSLDWSSEIAASAYEYVAESIEAKDPDFMQNFVSYLVPNITSMKFMSGYSDIIKYSVKNWLINSLDLKDPFPKAQFRSEKFTVMKEGWSYSTFDYKYSPPSQMDSGDSFTFTASIIDAMTLEDVGFVSIKYYIENDEVQVSCLGSQRLNENITQSFAKEVHLFRTEAEKYSR